MLKIAIVGPESTGKSTISQGLAKHFKTSWVPEYSRFYCVSLTAPCTLQDEINMFHGQVALQAAIESITDTGLIFCDTTFLTVKIWCDHQFGATPDIVVNALKRYHYDFYILLKNDIPWQPDPLRNFEGLGDYFMDIWRKELQSLKATYVEVGGVENRLQNAIDAVNNFLKEK